MAVVVSASKRTILGSDYVGIMRPPAAPGYGKVLYDYEEFSELWKTSKNRIVVFADKGSNHLVADLEGHPTRRLLQVGDIIVFENRPIVDKELNDVEWRERSQ